MNFIAPILIGYVVLVLSTLAIGYDDPETKVRNLKDLMDNPDRIGRNMAISFIAVTAAFLAVSLATLYFHHP